MDVIEIIPVKPGDVELLQAIGRQTFAETFAETNSEENMLSYLEAGFSLQKLTEELRNSNSRFYFAMLGGRPVGYLKLNFGPAQTETQVEDALEIERIYVLQEFLGMRVGQQLIDRAMQLAEQHQVNHVWLGVWEENPRAIRFYEKNGFAPFGKHIFRLGDDEQTDILMKREL